MPFIAHGAHVCPDMYTTVTFFYSFESAAKTYTVTDVQHVVVITLHQGLSVKLL